MAPVTITQAELLEALAASIPTAPDDARTVRELCVLTGLHYLKVRRAVALALADGTITMYRVRRPAIDGRRSVVSAYARAR